jgi:hypothetical protein
LYGGSKDQRQRGSRSPKHASPCSTALTCYQQTSHMANISLPASWQGVTHGTAARPPLSADARKGHRGTTTPLPAWCSYGKRATCRTFPLLQLPTHSHPHTASSMLLSVELGREGASKHGHPGSVCLSVCEFPRRHALFLLSSHGTGEV